jgi:hypothetical protein
MMIRTCKDCDAPFGVDEVEQDWCRAQGISLPRRCLNCRARLRGLVDEELACHDCGHVFAYPKTLAILVATFGWEPPATCICGCPTIEGSAQLFEGDRKTMAELYERMTAEPEPSAAGSGLGRATKPEDLFKGLADIIARAQAEEQAKGAHGGRVRLTDIERDEPKRALEAEIHGEPKSRKEEDVPKLDDLFRNLGGGPRRRTV